METLLATTDTSASTLCALITFSVLLPTLPLAAFYSIYYGLVDGVLEYVWREPVTESARGLVSALAAVGVVNLIVCAFVLLAYSERDHVKGDCQTPTQKKDE